MHRTWEIFVCVGLSCDGICGEDDTVTPLVKLRPFNNGKLIGLEDSSSRVEIITSGCNKTLNSSVPVGLS